MYHLNRRVVSGLSFVFRAVAVALTCLSPVLLLETYGQDRTQPPPSQREPTSREAARLDMEARQRALRSLENVKEKLSRRTSTGPRFAYRQIREDFEQLQYANHHLNGYGELTSALDYGQVRKDASEIKKRASRLKANLMLPEGDKDEKLQRSGEAPMTEELKPSIEALDKVVKSFAFNPVFQHPNVLDVENSVKARRDLEAIIKLSDHIQKRAEALNKLAGGSRN
ncbi:MAG TPA: hypothetical protein VIW80_23030 [Pyrinomonadaceae bacterium]|jgi:hypothetical protein